nr:MAG TPA: hypothetical protein [Caudoviricetes sp.]
MICSRSKHTESQVLHSQLSPLRIFSVEGLFFCQVHPDKKPFYLCITRNAIYRKGASL